MASAISLSSCATSRSSWRTLVCLQAQQDAIAHLLHLVASLLEGIDQLASRRDQPGQVPRHGPGALPGGHRGDEAGQTPARLGLLPARRRPGEHAQLQGLTWRTASGFQQGTNGVARIDRWSQADPG